MPVVETVEPQAEPQRTIRPGARIGGHVLLRRLGTGGSGQVWTAERVSELGFRKRVALKLLKRERLSDAKARDRFLREARVTARLRHPNVRPVFLLGEEQGQPYMSLRWAHATLEELVAGCPERRLPPLAVAWLGLECCAGLLAAHDHRAPDGASEPIVHGDLSPDNVLLTREGQVMLCDFGAAAEGRGHVGHGGFFGKPGYTAPEVLRGGRPTPRSDAFALGCVLYEALAGRAPFAAADETSAAYRVLSGPPQPLALGSEVSSLHLARAVEGALSADPEERSTVAQLAKQLHVGLEGTLRWRAEECLTDAIERGLGHFIDEREDELVRQVERLVPSTTTITLPALPTAARGDVDSELREASPALADGALEPGGPSRPSARKPRIRGFRWLWGAAVVLAAVSLFVGQSEWWADGNQEEAAQRAAHRESSPAEPTLETYGAGRVQQHLALRPASAERPRALDAGPLPQDAGFQEKAGSLRAAQEVPREGPRGPVKTGSDGVPRAEAHEAPAAPRNGRRTRRVRRIDTANPYSNADRKLPVAGAAQLTPRE